MIADADDIAGLLDGRIGSDLSHAGFVVAVPVVGVNLAEDVNLVVGAARDVNIARSSVYGELDVAVDGEVALERGFRGECGKSRCKEEGRCYCETMLHRVPRFERWFIVHSSKFTVDCRDAKICNSIRAFVVHGFALNAP